MLRNINNIKRHDMAGTWQFRSRLSFPSGYDNIWQSRRDHHGKTHSTGPLQLDVMEDKLTITWQANPELLRDLVAVRNRAPTKFERAFSRFVKGEAGLPIAGSASRSFSRSCCQRRFPSLISVLRISSRLVAPCDSRSPTPAYRCKLSDSKTSSTVC
jgi:hypothetical protein